MVLPFTYSQFQQLGFRVIILLKRNDRTGSGKHWIDLLQRISIRKKLILLSLLLFSILLVNGQPPAINDSVATLLPTLHFSSDMNSLNPDTLIFEKKHNRQINEGFTGNEFHYFLLKLSSTETLPDHYLTIDNNSLDSIYIFSIIPGEPLKKLYEGGRLIPYDSRKNFVWHIAPVNIGSEITYYLIAIKAAQKNINFHYRLSDYSHLLKKYEVYNRLVFFYGGIAFMISAIILLAFILFKKPVFGVYLGYMFCITFWILEHYGIIYPNMYPQLPALNQLSKPLSSLGAAFLLLTTQKFIFKDHLITRPVLRKLVQRLRYFLAGTITCSFFLLIPKLNDSLEIIYLFIWHTALVLSIVLIAFLPLYFIKKSEVAQIFSLAMIVICISTFLQLLATIGVIDNYFLNEHGMALGSVIENSIMAFGLLYSLIMERRNKNLQVISLQQEQREILEKLIYAQANERKRIATDLHDNLGPLLAALKINFRRIINRNGENSRYELIEKTEIIIDDSITEIRNIAHNLMPKNLESMGLIHCLEDYFWNVQQLYGKELCFTHEVYTLFKPELQSNIYFIISELVLNAVKHSHAELIHVSVKTGPRVISIQVLDNGLGFPVNQVMKYHSFGIQSAESRTRFLNGNFSLKSSEGKGTEVTIKIPL